jgi:hypothetical protein
MLHRAVLKYGDVNHNQALFHYHQACAAEILNHKIKSLGQLGPDQELFEDVSLFFFSQIQASAYGAWRAHLNAAKTLLNLWGVETLMGNPGYEFQLCHLALADIFGAAMAPASHITAEDVEQHKVYLRLLGRFKVDVCNTMVPIPEPIVRSVAAINISRAPKLPEVQCMRSWILSEPSIQRFGHCNVRVIHLAKPQAGRYSPLASKQLLCFILFARPPRARTRTPQTCFTVGSPSAYASFTSFDKKVERSTSTYSGLWLYVASKQSSETTNDR